MRVRYFAYGSNLDLARMRARAPAVGLIGPALLQGMRLAFDKRGGDGSGKANLAEDAASHV
jgi:gamma-glutamylcyclotransferase